MSLWSNLGVKVKPRTHIRGHLLTLFCDKWIVKLGDGDLTKVAQLSNSTVKTQAQIDLATLGPLKALDYLAYKSIQKDQYISTMDKQRKPASWKKAPKACQLP